MSDVGMIAMVLGPVLIIALLIGGIVYLEKVRSPKVAEQKAKKMSSQRVNRPSTPPSWVVRNPRTYTPRTVVPSSTSSMLTDGPDMLTSYVTYSVINSMMNEDNDRRDDVCTSDTNDYSTSDSSCSDDTSCCD